MSEDMAIVVPSCDKYSDLWQSFFFFFYKYWPDCPYPVYLLANERKFDDARVTTIKIGEEINWSDNLKKGLETIGNKTILILLEDYFLKEPVDSEAIARYGKMIQEERIAYLRLVPIPPPDADSKYDERLGIIHEGSAYRTSLQAAMWDRDALSYLLARTGSPWEFEIQGSIISSEIDGPFLSIKKEEDAPIKYYCTAVVQGKWMPGAIKMCKDMGAPVDTSHRPIMSQYEMTRERIRRPIRIKVDKILRKLRK